jgi:hypothetical protein
MSDRETPITKLSPAFIPLLMLCLMIAKILGPTEILKNKPNNIPLITAVIILNFYFV